MKCAKLGGKLVYIFCYWQNSDSKFYRLKAASKTQVVTEDQVSQSPRQNNKVHRLSFPRENTPKREKRIKSRPPQVKTF